MAGLKFPLEEATGVFSTIERCVKESVDPRAPGIPSHLPQNPGTFYTIMTYQRKHNPRKLWINRKIVSKPSKFNTAVWNAMFIQKMKAGLSKHTLSDTIESQEVAPVVFNTTATKHRVQSQVDSKESSDKSSDSGNLSSLLEENTDITLSSSEDGIHYYQQQHDHENLKLYSKYQLYYKSFNDNLGVHTIHAVHRQIDTYHLDLRYINISNLEFKAIYLTLLHCPMISRLDLTEVYIDDNKAVYLTDLFRENMFLTDLILKGCQLGYRQLKRILDTIRDRDNLAYLDVSCNKLNDESAFLLAKYIEGSSTLIYLIMSGNAFGETAGKYFGIALGENYYLRYLDLSKNHIRRSGARFLLSGIIRNHNLDKIDLSWNALREDGAGLLRKILENLELRRIDLTGTGMNTVCMQHIITGLKKNSSLEYIGLRNNPCLVEDYTHLLEAVHHNPESRLMQIDLGNQVLSTKAAHMAKELYHTRLIDTLFGVRLGSQGFILGDQVALMKINMALTAITKLKADKRVVLANYFKTIDQDPEECTQPLHKKKVDRECTFNSQAENGVVSYRAFALRLMMAGDNPERIIEEADHHLAASGPLPNLSVIRAEPDIFMIRDMELKTSFRSEMDDLAASVAKEPEVVQFLK